MNSFWTVVKYVSAVLFAITATADLVLTTGYRFRNPIKTETEIFLAYWQFMPVIVILAVLMILGFNKSDG